MKGTSTVDCAYQLGTGERKDYKRDFTAELTDDDGNTIHTIISANWSVDPDDGSLTLVNPWIADPIVGVYAEFPDPAKYYRLTVTVETSGTQIHEKVIGIGGIQKSGN